MSEVERVSDRVGIIRDGRLVAVETTEALVNKAFRHVRLTFAEPVDWRTYAALPGAEDLRSDRTSVSFTLHDNLDEVVKLAARNKLLGIDYEWPSLEEVFLTYYGHHENGGTS